MPFAVCAAGKSCQVPFLGLPLSRVVTFRLKRSSILSVQDLVTVLILPKTNTTSKEPVKLMRTHISHQQKSALPLNWIEPVQLEQSVAEAIIEKLTPMAARQIQQLLIDNQNQPTYGVYTSVRRQANRLLAANVEWNHLRFVNGIEGAQLWKVTQKHK